MFVTPWVRARVCPPRLAPVIFSIKQTGVPVGSLIGGLLIPLLLTISVYSATFKTPIHLDAYGTAFVTGLIVYLVAFFLQPIRAHFDADRNPSVELTFSGVSETMKFVISHPQLRDISFGAFAFGGLQSIFSGFFILFLIVPKLSIVSLNNRITFIGEEKQEEHSHPA